MLHFSFSREPEPPICRVRRRFCCCLTLSVWAEPLAPLTIQCHSALKGRSTGLLPRMPAAPLSSGRISRSHGPIISPAIPATLGMAAGPADRADDRPSGFCDGSKPQCGEGQARPQPRAAATGRADRRRRQSRHALVLAPGNGVPLPAVQGSDCRSNGGGRLLERRHQGNREGSEGRGGCTGRDGLAWQGLAPCPTARTTQ